MTDPWEFPALVDDMPFKRYLADPTPEPSLTSSLIRDLLASAPRYVEENTSRLNPDYRESSTEKFDLGSAAHQVLIGGGRRIAWIPYDSYRSGAAKAARAAAYDAEETPILEQHQSRTYAMADAARAQFVQNPDVGWIFRELQAPDAVADQADNVQREVSIFWRETGITCRCRPDLYARPGPNDEPPVIVHYKTTPEHLAAHTLPRYASNLGWHLTASHYAAGVAALTGLDPRQYFAIQQNRPPYLARVVRLPDIWYATGDMLRERAIAAWARCVRSGHWPGHSSGTLDIDLPPWVENTAVEIKDRRNAMADAPMMEVAKSAGIWPAAGAKTPTASPAARRSTGKRTKAKPASAKPADEKPSREKVDGFDW